MHHAGQLSSGPHLSPIKMMDEPTNLFTAFSYTVLHVLLHPHTQTHSIVGGGLRGFLTENNMSVKGHSLLCGFKPKKHNPLKGEGWSFPLLTPPPSLSPPCTLPHSFLSPVHASGIPLDPLNEGHIAGLAKRGEWERRRGVTKEISVRGRESEQGSTGLVFHDCALMADGTEKGGKKKLEIRLVRES